MRGGKLERVAVRLNAILRHLPRMRSLDGKQWREETHDRRDNMRFLVKAVLRLFEEETLARHERGNAEYLATFSPQDRALFAQARAMGGDSAAAMQAAVFDIIHQAKQPDETGPASETPGPMDTAEG